MKTKQQNDEFPLLDPEIVEAVPNLQDPDGPGKDIHDAARLARKLEADRKNIIEALSHCSGDGPMGPGTTTRYDPSADAEALLNGTPVTTLIAPVTETERASLLRRLRAVDAAIPQAKDRVGEIETQIVVKECGQFRAVAQAIIEDVVRAAENLLVCLQAQDQFFSLLDKRGFHAGKRCGWMTSQAQEIGWLAGDVHRPPLAAYIKNRRESAGLKEKE